MGESWKSLGESWADMAAQYVASIFVPRNSSCYACHSFDATDGEVKIVQLSTDGPMEFSHLKFKTAETTRREGSLGKEHTSAAVDFLGKLQGHTYQGDLAGMPMTAWEQDVKDRIQLPVMHQYPCPPTCSPADTEEKRREELLSLYQNFIVELHKGVSLMLVSSDEERSAVHCWISEDFETLKIDQGSGCVVEFPLKAVATVQRLVRNGLWFPGAIENVVVIEFMRRKLAFAFEEQDAAVRFLIGLKLLVYKAQGCKPRAYCS